MRRVYSKLIWLVKDVNHEGYWKGGFAIAETNQGRTLTDQGEYP